MATPAADHARTRHARLRVRPVEVVDQRAEVGIAEMGGGLADNGGPGKLRGFGHMAQYLSDVSDRTNGKLRLGPQAASSARSVTAANLGGNEEVWAWMRPEFIDAIARRVLELAAGADPDRSSSGTGLLTVSEVARRLNVSQHWVYAHKRDLGAIRLGQGPKARLRFEVAAVLEALMRRTGSTGAGTSGIDDAPKSRRRRLDSRPLPRASRAA
jgi:hypothetical protein